MGTDTNHLLWFQLVMTLELLALLEHVHIGVPQSTFKFACTCVSQ